MNIEIYCDGSARNQGKENPYGAWGYVILENGINIKESTEMEISTTNNRMELMSIISPLKWMLENSIIRDVTIYSDSEYCVKGLNERIDNWQKSNWKKGKIKNQDLWIELQALKQRMNSINLVWVKAHTKDNIWNNYVDMLCSSNYENKKN